MAACFLSNQNCSDEQGKHNVKYNENDHHRVHDKVNANVLLIIVIQFFKPLYQTFFVFLCLS